MSILVEPEDLLTEFLRAEITELTHDGATARQTNTTETASGTGSKTAFVLTQSNLVCVNSVVVGGTTMKKFTEYQVDWDNKTITFTTAPASGTDNITFDYDHNNNWIFPDKPRDDLALSSYPRISVVKINEPAVPLGVGGSNQYWHEILFQIDCLAYKDEKVTISSEVFEGPELVRYMARQVVNKLVTQDQNKLFAKLFDPFIVDNRPVPFEETKNIFRQIVQVTLKAQNLGQ